MTLKDNAICFTNALQRAGIDKKVRQSDHDQQARFLLVIFENLAATLRITLSKTESNEEV